MACHKQMYSCVKSQKIVNQLYKINKMPTCILVKSYSDNLLSMHSLTEAYF